MAGYADPTTAIQSLYKQYGMQPGGRGSGFADLDYWAEKANQSGGWSDYWQNRLGSDLAGTGTDQPTGTPGQGPWQQSGRGGSMPRTTTPADQLQGLQLGQFFDMLTKRQAQQQAGRASYSPTITTNTPGQFAPPANTYDDFIKRTIASGVSPEEAQRTAQYVFGQPGATQTPRTLEDIINAALSGAYY